MNESLLLILSGLVGAVLGVLFFGGLWWTVRKALASPYPAMWFLTSMLLRMGVVLSGFYYVSDGQWKRLVAALLGFIIARFGVMWLTRVPNRQGPTSEATHAS